MGSDGVLYFGSYDGNLYAVDPDGNNIVIGGDEVKNKKWSYSLGSFIRYKPIIGNNGNVKRIKISAENCRNKILLVT